MTIASRALASARYAKEQVTAYYLAQEGIELVRAIRDGKTLIDPPLHLNENEGSQPWIGDPGQVNLCYSTEGCTINSINMTVRSCNSFSPASSCGLLSIDGNGFYVDTVGSSSGYYRVIKIKMISNEGNPNGGDNEAVITSTVTWQSSVVGGVKSVVVVDHLTKWQQ